MQTIAEWAEDTATVQTLAEIGVDYVQGYVVARPQRPEALLTAESSASFIRDEQLLRFTTMLGKTEDIREQVDLFDQMGGSPTPGALSRHGCRAACTGAVRPLPQAARRPCAILPDLGLVDERVGRVARLQDVLQPGLHRLDRLRVAVDVELPLPPPRRTPFAPRRPP
jgi:hypothetical protein